MVDHLKEQRSPMSRIGLAYMYCDYRDHIEQTAENILGTLLTQLLEILPGIPEAVLNLYEQRSRSLSSEEAVGLLWVICAEFSKIDICIDALDELDTRNLRSLLKCLHEGPYSIQIFLTGRPHVQETVREYFEEERSITIEAHASDIRRFIEHEIGGSDDIEPKAMDKKLRTNIFHKIVDSAKGMLV